ncbi:MAG: class I tRNA ligase family protein, partial [Clostridia bacterium]|nr:class I tRNA ligase family protein [Clostridia bacterium]
NRRRFWKTGDEEDKMLAYWVLFNAINACTLIMAPIIPFMTEEIWQKLTRRVLPGAALSVHLADWPKPLEGFEDDGVLQQTADAREIIAVALKLRNEHQIKVRQPLSKLYLSCDDAEMAKIAVFEKSILDELNIKELVHVSDPAVLEDSYLALNFRAAGAVLKQNVNKMKQALEAATADEMAAYVAAVITVVFLVLKKTVGLRADPVDEIQGLDVSEHGLLTAYSGFAMSPDTSSLETAAAPVVVSGDTPPAEAVPVKRVPSFEEGRPKFTKVEILCKESRFEALKNAMTDLGITGMTVSHVLGCGQQKGRTEYYRGIAVEATLLPKVQVDIVVSKIPVRAVIETAKKVLYTGHIGDGKIFVYDVENVVKVRTGEEGYDALQDVE